MTTDEGVAEIAARAEAATEGPWNTDGPVWWFKDWADHEGESICTSLVTAGVERSAVVMPPDPYGADQAMSPNANAEADLAFIAHARDDIPFLLSEVRRLRSVVEDAEKVIADVESARRVADGAQADILIGRPEMDALEEIALQDRLIDEAIATYRAGADHE